MKIAFFEIKKWQEDYLKSKLTKHKLYFSEKPINIKNSSKCKEADAIVSFIYSELNEKILSEFRNLKYISTMSTGFDHIDLNYCKSKSIKISNVPSYGENTVAEYTFALILALSRKVHKAVNKTKLGDFSLSGLMGFDLKDKTLGVIGAGRIGQHVIKIANGFNMNVIVFSKNKDSSLDKILRLKLVSLNHLLAKSDIITLHVPLTNETKHMINLNNVKKMKKGVYIINTSRGEVIDNSALLHGLNNGIIAGAGLDVLEGECEVRDEKELLKSNKFCNYKILLENHQLIKDKDVLVTPHSAFYTREALIRILDTTVSNIRAFLRGRVRNRVA